MQIRHSPLSSYVWLRVALVLGLFACTLYPLGEGATSVSPLLHKVLRFFIAGSPLFILSTMVLWCLLFWAGFIPALEREIDHLWQRMKARPATAVWILSFFFLSVAVLLCYLIYGLLPRIPDSVAQYVHAKVIASGHLLGAPLPAESFDTLCMITRPFLISHYMPLHAIIQAAGHLVHMPWLVNTLLGATCVWLIYLLAYETHGRDTALRAAIIASLCPYMLLMSAEFMNHASSLLLASLFYLGFVRAYKYHRIRDGLLAGACLGLILLTRTFTAAMLAYPGALYVFFWLICKRDIRLGLLRGFAPCAVMAGAFIPLVMQFNILTTGNALVFSNQITQGQYNTIGFGPVPPGMRDWVGTEFHDFWRGVLYSSNNLVGLNYFLLRWPFPALLLVASAFLLRSRNEWNLIFLTFFGCMLLGHTLYYTQDWCFGPRYLYETAPLLIILMAEGLRRVTVYVRFFSGIRPKQKCLRPFILLFILTGVATTGYSLLPDHNIDGCTVVHRNIYHTARERGMKNVLLLVPGLDYITSAAALPPHDTTDVIIVRDGNNEENQFVMEYFPRRDVFRVDENNKFTLVRPGNLQAVNPPRVQAP